jgi:hypothetical protein
MPPQIQLAGRKSRAMLARPMMFVNRNPPIDGQGLGFIRVLLRQVSPCRVNGGNEPDMTSKRST